MSAEGDGTMQMSARTAEMSAPSRNLPLDLSDFPFLTIRISCFLTCSCKLDYGE